MKSEIQPLCMLSVIIPARNEEDCIAATVRHLYEELKAHKISHEILVVNDGSTDQTAKIISGMRSEVPTLRPLTNRGLHGYGHAVIYGIDHMNGDAAVIMMADESDDCRDVVRYWERLNEGADCVFGSRFIDGGKTVDYPLPKYILNRLGNKFIQLLFGLGLNDVTNAFKAYRKEALEACRPFVARHFNLTVELPLKAIVRGFKWSVIPISWRNRTQGVAKFKIKEIGSRYLFIILYVWLENFLCREDYWRRKEEKKIRRWTGKFKKITQVFNAPAK